MDASAKMSLENKHWCKQDHFAIISCCSHSVFLIKTLQMNRLDCRLSKYGVCEQIYCWVSTEVARRFTERGIGGYKKLKNRTNNRKPKLFLIKTESEKMCTQSRSLRRIFFKEKPEKHWTASNRRSGHPILFLLKNREWNRTENANRKSQKAKNRGFWVQKPV